MIDLEFYEFSLEKIEEISKNSLHESDQKKLIVSLLTERHYYDILEVFMDCLRKLSIEQARVIIDTLDENFLTQEQYKQRVKQLENNTKGVTK